MDAAVEVHAVTVDLGERRKAPVVEAGGDHDLRPSRTTERPHEHRAVARHHLVGHAERGPTGLEGHRAGEVALGDRAQGPVRLAQRPHGEVAGGLAADQLGEHRGRLRARVREPHHAAHRVDDRIGAPVGQERVALDRLGRFVEQPLAPQLDDRRQHLGDDLRRVDAVAGGGLTGADPDADVGTAQAGEAVLVGAVVADEQHRRGTDSVAQLLDRVALVGADDAELDDHVAVAPVHAGPTGRADVDLVQGASRVLRAGVAVVERDRRRLDLAGEALGPGRDGVHRPDQLLQDAQRLASRGDDPAVELRAVAAHEAHLVGESAHHRQVAHARPEITAAWVAGSSDSPQGEDRVASGRPATDGRRSARGCRRSPTRTSSIGTRASPRRAECSSGGISSVVPSMVRCPSPCAARSDKNASAQSCAVHAPTERRIRLILWRTRGHPHRLGDRVDHPRLVVRVDLQRRLQLAGGGGELAEHQDAAVVDADATYSSATRFMPSRNGVTSITSAARYNATSSSLVEPNGTGSAPRRPDLAVVAVDLADELLDLLALGLVVPDVLPTGDGDLHHRHVAGSQLVLDEQGPERVQAGVDALGVVEAVDAEARAAGCRAAPAGHRPPWSSAGRH